MYSFSKHSPPLGRDLPHDQSKVQADQLHNRIVRRAFTLASCGAPLTDGPDDCIVDRHRQSLPTPTPRHINHGMFFRLQSRGSAV